MVEAGTKLSCMEIWGGNRPIETAVSVPGIDAWVYSEPHGGAEAGGDIYFLSTCGHGEISRIAVADVSGHGRSASAASEGLRGLMRKHINRLDQLRFVRDLNRGFQPAVSKERFATALVSTYQASTETLTICNAGHPLPLWFRARRGTWQAIDPATILEGADAGNMPLGILDSIEFKQFALPLDVGDLILLYSDGLLDATSPSGGRLGMSGLEEIVRRAPTGSPMELLRHVREAVRDYREGGAPEDDVTVLALGRNGGRPPALSLGDKMRLVGKMLGLVRV